MATGLQGPAGGVYLSDMGAEVIKGEPPASEASRFHRGVGNYLSPDAPGGQFVAAGRGKKSIALDVHWDTGKEVVHRLVERADVFLSNYLDEALERMGMGYAALQARNPRIIY